MIKKYLGALALMSAVFFTGHIAKSDSYVGVPSGILSINGLTGTSQTLVTGTAGSDFNISSTGTAHTFNAPNASASSRGLLISSDWSAFNAKQAALPTPSSAHVYNVSVTGNDSTCDGSLALPCATISKAESLIPASPQSQYIISVGPGNFTDAFKLKPRTIIIGVSSFSTRILSTADISCADSEFATNAGQFGIYNVNISGSGAFPNINCNLAAIGGSSNSALILKDIQLGGTFTYSGRTDADFVEIFGGVFFGNLTFHGGQNLLDNAYVPASISMDSTGISDDESMQLLSSFVDGSVSINTGNSIANIFQSTASPVSGTLTLNGSAISALMDSVSSGSLLVLQNNPSVTGYTMGIALVNGASYSANAPLVIKDGHMKSTQTTAPTTKVTSNAGTGGSCAVANATDMTGQITLITTATAPGAGVQCGINFNKAYNLAPICFLSSANNSASTLAVLSGVYVTTTAQTMGVNFANSDAIGHTYVENYRCIETQ